MKILIILFILIFYTTANSKNVKTPNTHGKTEHIIKILNKCSKPECVVMDLNWGPKKPKFKTKNAAPHTFFLFNVIGKLKEQKVKLHKVQVVGFTDGIRCGDFGQSSAAVLGIKNGNPIIETSGGQLEILDHSLSVGCSNCIQIINKKTKKIENKYFSPGWDLTLTRHKNSNFSYDENGNAYISSNNKCLKIPKSGFYTEAEGQCRPLKKVGYYKKNYKNFKAKPAEWYYKAKDSKSVMFLRSGACS